jgi:hypothetical protein
VHGGSGAPTCDPGGDQDHDKDGYSVADGDCNDCDPNANPGAYDVPSNGKDEDCSGVSDDDPAPCDAKLDLASTDPFDGAKAIGLCKKADPKTRTYGVVSAAYVLPDGTPLAAFPESHGLLPAFGTNGAQEGAAMLALSSGAARAPGQPGYRSPDGYDKNYTSGTPAGYPKESPACKGVITGPAHDGVGLLLTIRVPTNAHSFSLEESFFTFEFPDYICSPYNDFFVAILTPTPAGQADGNIAFDQQGNPISVNNSLLQVCTAQVAGGKSFPCPLGPALLAQTGFDEHAATGWLKTQAPVKAGSEITLLLTAWDSGDGVLDSTVLVDAFGWSADEAGSASTVPAPPR